MTRQRCRTLLGPGKMLLEYMLIEHAEETPAIKPGNVELLAILLKRMGALCGSASRPVTGEPDLWLLRRRRHCMKGMTHRTTR